MTRKRVKLSYITDDTARKATFRKRKKSIMKKAQELSTLCGIETCAVICSPYEPQPAVWASAPGAEQVLAKFMSVPEMDKSKKVISQEGYIRQRLQKAREHLQRQQKDNRKKVITQIMNQCLAGRPVQSLGNMDDLNDLDWLINNKYQDILRRLETLKQQVPPPPLPLPLPPPLLMAGGQSAPAYRSNAFPPMPHSYPLPLPYHHHTGMNNLAAAAGQRPPWTLMDSMNNDQHISFGGVGDNRTLPYVHLINPPYNNGMWPGPPFN